MQQVRAGFEALPESDRKALQDHLIWTGFYKGSIDGEFGRMTFSAMRAFDQRYAAGGEPLPAAPARARLAAMADRSRKAVGFRIIVDLRSGVRIGVPQALLPRKADLTTGTRYATADRSVALDVFRLREGETGLQSLYEKFRAPQAGRRVTYSIIRPGFFVVASETPASAAYTRVTLGEADGVRQLRGFSLTWPRKFAARYEMIAVAVAASFDPFGQRATPALRPEANAGTAAKDSAESVPAAPRLAASAIAVAANRYVAFVPGNACNGMMVGKRPARILKVDSQSGLALLDVPGGTGIKLRASPVKAQAGAPVLAIFAGPGLEPAAAVIEVAAGEIAALPASREGRSLHAAVAAQAQGGLVLTRTGELAGLIAPDSGHPRPPGAPPAATRNILGADRLAAFLASSGVDLVAAPAAAEAQSAGRIASQYGSSVEPLFCQP